MKVTCPHCEKLIKAPDAWAGRLVKCPGCKQPITLTDEEPSSGGLDLTSLGTMESAGTAVQFERPDKPMTLQEAKEAAVAARPADEKPAKIDPCLRTCTKCGQQVRTEDVYADIMCRHCGASGPGPRAGETKHAK